MSWMVSDIALTGRRLLRRTGLASPIAAFLNRRGYEQRVNDIMMANLRAGDIVWDVGANVGHYSTLMAQKAGETGKVYAFEPSPKNRERLQLATAGYTNIVLMPVALADSPGTFAFREGTYGDGHDARVVRDHETGDDLAKVRVETGDRLVANGEVALPTFIKIDVEGFEIDVLRGMLATLKHQRLRAVVVEVHYAQMEEQGHPRGGQIVEQMILDAGLSVRWIGIGHIFATRKTT